MQVWEVSLRVSRKGEGFLRRKKEDKSTHVIYKSLEASINRMFRAISAAFKVKLGRLSRVLSRFLRGAY